MESANVTCPGPPRIVDSMEHISRLSDWFHQTYECLNDTAETEPLSWPSVAYWFALAAGLRELEIDLTTRASWMCSRARQYEVAASDTASSYHLELTRLLYVYAGAEVAVTVMTQGMSDNVGAMNRLMRVFGAERISLQHDMCTLRHLADHISEETVLRNNAKLARIVSNYEHDPAMAAARIGFQFRHLFAHGNVAHPAPVGEGDSWEDGAGPERCIVRNAITCLLLTVQRLMMQAVSSGQLTPDDYPIELADGLWLGGDDPDSQWAWEADPSEYIAILHLEHGLGPGGITP